MFTRLQLIQVFAVFVGLSLGSCGLGGGTVPPSSRVEITAARAPHPVMVGSLIEVRGLNFDRVGEDAILLAGRRDGRPTGLTRVRTGDDARWLFEVSGALVGNVGEGVHDLDLVLAGPGVSSAAFVLQVRVAFGVDILLDGVPSGDVRRNERAVLSGDGFLSENEGLVEAHFDGDYTYEDGRRIDIDVYIPVIPAEEFSRDRGVVELTTAIGGVEPGTFLGTIGLVSRSATGETSRSTTWRTNLTFLPPALYELVPNPGALEQLVQIRGAGFIGGSGRTDEVTIIRLDGDFTRVGGSPRPFGPLELVPAYRGGELLEWRLEAEERAGELRSSFFGASAGVFVGTVVPLTVKGTTEVVGSTSSLTFTLGPIRQVVYLRFVPSFYDSLELFGLTAAADGIAERVAARIEDIYRFWNVEVRLSRPTDYSPNGFSTLEIGGTDPNGVGLFGYDNTPGKDVGNLRLFDAIGGANAETQDDGFPGYGGVFVESFLYWSTHPDLPGSPPASAPDPDPLFDEIFDPVRAQPATLAEVGGEGSPGRVAVVGRAIAALSNMIGETSAHELGHSFGLAEPYGSSRVFHNSGDGPGCLMDSGSNRPLGERMGEPGFARTQLCNGAPEYLDEILPLD